MREKVIIYGAGKIGTSAICFLKDIYDILFICDKNEKKWGIRDDGIEVCSPNRLNDFRNIKLIIASSYFLEILSEIEKYNMKNVIVFEMNFKKIIPNKIIKQLDKKTIELGNFFAEGTHMKCKELTFVSGSSGILDYFFLKQLAIQFNCKSYLEIGTYIGESINILTDVCEDLYSITLPPEAPFSARSWCKSIKLPDYSERLTYHDKITHFYDDSKLFDYSVIPKDIDLFFIDGDHSYEGVFSDTKNIFKIKKRDAIVVWHDFKTIRNQYNADVVEAVADALGEDFMNVYVCDNNMCGIYLPYTYKDKIKLITNQYDNSRRLWVYNTELDVHTK